MLAAKPELHAVVEIALPSIGSWLRLPPEPWPDFVRLCASTSSQDVALLVAVVSSYGRAGGAPASSIRGALEEFPQILPGGIAVVAGEQSIMPSCCCGLETWPEWRKVVGTGQSPWMGHDPAPFVEVVGDQIQVWSDGGMGEKPANQEPIILSREEFMLALARVSDDLKAFLVPLGGWLDEHVPQHASEFLMRFQRAFVRA